jgi:hypothetical protein
MLTLELVVVVCVAATNEQASVGCRDLANKAVREQTELDRVIERAHEKLPGWARHVLWAGQFIRKGEVYVPLVDYRF